MSVTTGTAPPTVDFDHNSPEYARDWRDIYVRMRQHCPVARSEAYGGYYVLTRYDDVARAVKDDDTFSSLHDPSPGSPYGGIIIPPSPTISTPIEMDPPDFTPLRRLLNPFFSPALADRWEPFTRDVTTAMLDGVIESGSIDLVNDLASPVPAILTAALLGLPLDEWRMYADAAHTITYTPPDSEAFPKAVEGMMTMVARSLDVAVQRRAEPKDDIMTAIVQFELPNGERLSDQRVVEIATLIIGGGDDTTTGLIANACQWLSHRPEQKDWLREDFGRLDRACEEFLRYFTPTQGLARTVRRPVEIGGYQLQPGDRVWLSFASANQDPDVFDRPDEVVLDRFPNRHQAFGFGLHRCAGSNYTRMEFRVVLEEVLKRIPDFTVDHGQSKRYENVGIVNGWERMPATFTLGAKLGSGFRL